MEEEERTFSILRKLKAQRPLTVPDAADWLAKNGGAKEVPLLQKPMFVVNPGLYEEHGKRFTVIFLRAPKYFDMGRSLLREHPDLNVYSLYGAFDYAITGFMSEKRAEQIQKAAAPHPSSSFVARKFHRYRGYHVQRDIAAQSKGERVALARLVDSPRTELIAREDRVNLQRTGHLLGLDLELSDEVLRWVKVFIGVAPERDVEERDLDRLAEKLLSLDAHGNISSLYMGFSEILPYKVLLEIEVPLYHDLDRLTNELIGSDFRTHTIFVANTKRETIQLLRPDALSEPWVPPSLQRPRETIALNLPEKARDFEALPIERRLRILTNLHELQGKRDATRHALPDSHHSEVELLTYRYARALIEGRISDQLEAVHGVTKMIEGVLRSSLQQYSERKWRDSEAGWQAEAEKFFATSKISAGKATLGTLISALQKIADAGELKVAEKDRETILSGLSQIKEPRDRGAHVSEVDLKDVVIDDLAEEQEVFAGMLKAVLVLYMADRYFRPDFPADWERARSNLRASETLREIKSARDDIARIGRETRDHIDGIAVAQREQFELILRSLDELHARQELVRIPVRLADNIATKADQLAAAGAGHPQKSDSSSTLSAIAARLRALSRGADEVVIIPTTLVREVSGSVRSILSSAPTGEIARLTANLVAELGKLLLG